MEKSAVQCPGSITPLNHIIPPTSLHSQDIASVCEKGALQLLETPSVDAEKRQDIIDFENDGSENPLLWSSKSKWTIVALLSTMSLLDMFTTIAIVPAVPQILSQFQVKDDLYYTLLVSVWELGEGFGPFLVAPLSELYGRLPVYHIGNVLFLLCSVGSALSTNISMLVAFRSLNGFVITSLTLGPSIVADLFEKEERGTAMAIAITVPLIGPVVAPIVGSFIAQAKGWRWVIWITVVAIGAVTGLSFVFFRETYSVIILQRKTERLQKSSRNYRLRSKHQNGKRNWSESLKRPLMMLFLSPTVFILSMYTAATYGLSYLLLTTLSKVMIDAYEFNEGIVGLSFLGIATGNLIGLLLYGLTSDRYVKHKQAVEGTMKPEHRLPLMLVGAIILPVGFLIYGWTAAKHVQWITPILGTSITGISAALVMLPSENYLVDSYDLYGASAIAANVILRAIFGAILPLAGPSLYNNLGLGWGNSVLALIAVAFIPAVVVLMRYGEQIRNSSWSDRGRHLWVSK